MTLYKIFVQDSLLPPLLHSPPPRNSSLLYWREMPRSQGTNGISKKQKRLFAGNKREKRKKVWKLNINRPVEIEHENADMRI